MWRRKMKKTLLLILIVSLIFGIYAYADEFFIDKEISSLEKSIKKIDRTITDEREILNLAEKYNLEDSENIVGIIFSYNNCKEIPVSEQPIEGTREFGADEIYFKDIVTTEERGELLRSSYYTYPGGTMTVSDSVSASFSTTVGLSSVVVSAEIGFDVTATYSISDSQNISVPYGKTYNVKAYVNNQKKSFEIWEDDLLFDDYLGTGETYKPIGVIFVIYR
jgi:hypothetical protein